MPIRVTSRRSNASQQPSKPACGTPFGLPVAPVDWAQREPGLSLCMIVKNEERFLEQCLASAQSLVDEIIVVDTGSSDSTIEIAKRFGARVEHREWRNDFAWARNEALKLATKRWIIVLDADEELLPESGEALAALKAAPAYNVGVWVRCQNRADDYQGTGAMSHALVRIFPNHDRIKYRGLIHEFITIDDDINGIKAVPSPVAIVHHGYLKEVVAERNKGERNLEIVKAATEKDPGDPFNWFNVGMTAHLMGREEEALAGFERMRELNGKQPRGFMPNGLSTLADIYTEKMKQPEKGLQIARECLAFSPHYANAHFAMGKALVELQRYDEARAAYLQAIEDGSYLTQQFVVDDEVPVWKAQCEIGTTYAVQGNDEKAIEWFDKGIANRPTAQPIRLNRARALERLHRFSEAEPALRSLYEEFQDEQTTLHYINYLLRRGENLRALEIVDRSIDKLQPRTAVTTLVAAAAVCQKSGMPGAQRYLETAARLLPGCAEALNPLEALYREQNNETALAQLLADEDACEPAEPADFLRRSHRRLAEQQYEDALQCAERGLAAAEDALLRYNAAVAALNVDKKYDALRHLDAIGPEHALVYPRAEYLKAIVLRELDETQQALAAVDRLLAIDSNQVEAILLRASLLERAGRAADAESLLTKSLPLSKQRVAVELAGLYMRAGRLHDAKAVAEAALA